MSRTLSLTLRHALNAEQTDAIPVFLVTIRHDDLAEAIRLTSDPTVRLSSDPLLYGTLSRSNIYEFVPFNLITPEDGDEAPPSIKFRLDFTDPDTIAVLRSTSTPAQVTVELVLASDPDTVEIEYPTFDLVEANYSDKSIELTLIIDSLVSEPFPSGSFTPAGFAGLF